MYTTDLAEACNKSPLDDSSLIHSTGLVPVAEDLQKRLEERITEFTLPSNGMHFIVMERHNAPIVSCNTYANVGAFDEEDGRTGATSPISVTMNIGCSVSIKSLTGTHS